MLAAWAVGLAVAAQAVHADPTPTLHPPGHVRPPGTAPHYGLSFTRELNFEIGGVPPSMSYSSQQHGQPSSKRVVAVYGIGQRYVARSLSTFGPHPLQPLWADSRTCPAILDGLKALDNFPLSIKSPLKPFGMIVVDGVNIILRTQATAGAWPADVTISGDAPSLEEWADAMNRAIDPCLTLEPPADLPPADYDEDAPPAPPR